jgi:hypothetical protein
MKARQFGDAAKTLAQLRHFSPSIWMECDAVELKLVQTDLPAALALAGTVLALEDAAFQVVNCLDDLFAKADRKHWWKKLLERAGARRSMLSD